MFRFGDGTSVTLRPGEGGVTEADIRVLHSLDDAEVYSNIKNSRPALTEAEKAAKKEWEAAHPGEQYPANWNLSFNYMAGDDGNDDSLDKSRIASETCTYMDTDLETEEEMIRRMLWDKHPEHQQASEEGSGAHRGAERKNVTFFGRG